MALEKNQKVKIMPWTRKQKKAMYAEISRRNKGQKAKLFKGMSLAQLRREVKEPTKSK